MAQVLRFAIVEQAIFGNRIFSGGRKLEDFFLFFARSRLGALGRWAAAVVIGDNALNRRQYFVH